MIRIHCAPRIAALHRSNIVITTYFSRSHLPFTPHHHFNPRGLRVPKCPKLSSSPPVLEEKFDSIRFDSREIDLREEGRKIHGENSGNFFYFAGRTAEMANLYASTVFDFNENLRWVSLSLSPYLSPPILRIGRSRARSTDIWPIGKLYSRMNKRTDKRTGKCTRVYVSGDFQLQNL